MLRNERRSVQGILRIGVNPHRIVCADGQGLTNDGVAIRLTNRDGCDGSPVLLFQFERTDEGVPFVVRVDNELNAIGVKLCVAFCEGNPARGVRGFADANEKLHGH